MGIFNLDVFKGIRDTVCRWLASLKTHLPGATAARESLRWIAWDDLDAVDLCISELTSLCIQRQIKYGHLTGRSWPRLCGAPLTDGFFDAARWGTRRLLHRET